MIECKIKEDLLVLQPILSVTLENKTQLQIQEYLPVELNGIIQDKLNDIDMYLTF